MRILAIIFISVVLSGCSSGMFGQHYIELASPEAQKNLTKPDRWKEPKYYLSHKIQQDLDNLKASGYVLLGTSRFSHHEFAFNQAAKQAKKVGATHVIYARNQPVYNHNQGYPEFSQLNELDDLEQLPAPAFMGFAAAAQQLGKIKIDKILSGGSNKSSSSSSSSKSSSSSSYRNNDYHYYPSTTHHTTTTRIIHRNVYDFQTYFVAKRNDFDRFFGLTLGDHNGQGVIISDVRPGSIAERLKLQKLDIITNINGIPVTDRENAIEILTKSDELSAQTSFFIRREGEDFVSVIPPLMAM